MCLGRLSVHRVHPDHDHDAAGAHMGHTAASTAEASLAVLWQLGGRVISRRSEHGRETAVNLTDRM